MSEMIVVTAGHAGVLAGSAVVRAARDRGIECLLVREGRNELLWLEAERGENSLLAASDPSSRADSRGSSERLARRMLAVERGLASREPELVLLAGNGDSTFAAALVASALRIPTARIDAGVRFDSRDRNTTALVCDHASALLFCAGAHGRDRLLAEGVSPAAVDVVGSPLPEILVGLHAGGAERVRSALGLRSEYAVVSFARPAEDDSDEELAGTLEAVLLLSRCVPLVLLLNPHRRETLVGHGLERALASERDLLEPDRLSAADLVALVGGSSLVLTDSDALQEDATVLGVPCLTMRESTARPLTVLHGTNQLVGTDPERIVEAALVALECSAPPVSTPPLWDGQASSRIVERLLRGARALENKAARAPANHLAG
jgi:UDP-N-acetylglucosamine 2-epimerase (non-hydrolysing)